MLVRARHILIGCAATAAAVAGILLVYLYLRHAGDLEAAVQDADLAVVAAVLAALGAGAVGGWACWRVQSNVQALAEQLSAVRHSPSRASLDSGRFSATQIA